MTGGQQRQLDPSERLDWLSLVRTETVGPVTAYRLLERFGSARKALEALPEMAARGGRKKPPKTPDRRTLQREVKALEKLGGRFIAAIEPDYPPLLRHAEDAPPVIAIIGQAALMNRPTVAIIGARNASLNGKRFAKSLAADLGAAGYLIVSGFARGIDQAAHHGAIGTGTAGVLAGGVDVIYPPEQRELYDAMRGAGALIGEMPLGTKPQGRHFPKRNRLIAGMAQAVIVVEAAQRSGSLITAGMAADYGRDVLAVPGSPLDPRAHGTNRLIQEGAPLIQSADDVIDALKRSLNGMSERQPDLFTARPPTQSAPAGELDDARQRIVDCLGPAPTPVDDVIRDCQVTAASAQVVLLELEVAGRLTRLPGNKVALVTDIEQPA